MKKEMRVYARPHPGPLPRGEGEPRRVAGKFATLFNLRRVFLFCAGARPNFHHSRLARNLRMILPLLGERAGVRASVKTFSPICLGLTLALVSFGLASCSRSQGETKKNSAADSAPVTVATVELVPLDRTLPVIGT